MKRDTNDIDTLIANYLSGEGTPEEVAFIDAWRRDENNERYFAQLRLIFHKAASAPATGAFDADTAWQNLQTKLAERRAEKSLSATVPGSSYRPYWRVAAGIIVLLSVGLFAYRFFRSPLLSIELVTVQKTKADTLPNGSSVFLNRQTRIKFTSDSKNTHIAKLQGEAYFHINHSNAETFVVEANGTFIKDIGTSFNVNAYPDSATVEVVVDEGEVIFYTEGNPGIHIHAKGKGVYNKTTGTFSVSEPEPNVTAYKTRVFTFNNDSLSTIVKTLNAVYETQIDIGKNLRACRLTVSFNDENIDEISQIIAETLGLTVSHSGNVILLKGSGCQQQSHE